MEQTVDLNESVGEKLSDTIDLWEDSLIGKELCWSESLQYTTIINGLKRAKRKMDENGVFDEYDQLVNAALRGEPIYDKYLPGLGTGIGYSLIGNLSSVLLNIIEMAWRSIYGPFAFLRETINTKYKTADVIIGECVVLDEDGVAAIEVEANLPSNSEDQYIKLRHPSKTKYDLHCWPKVSVENSSKRTELKWCYKTYRVIAYRADKGQPIDKVVIKGNPGDQFTVYWSDTYPIRK